MPTYEYECDKCKKHFDIFHSMSDDPIKKCPECGGKFHRLIGGGSGIIFKGSGFYENDYKKKKGKTGENAPSCPAASDARLPGGQACKNCPSNKGKKH